MYAPHTLYGAFIAHLTQLIPLLEYHTAVMFDMVSKPQNNIKCGNKFSIVKIKNIAKKHQRPDVCCSGWGVFIVRLFCL